MRTALTAAALAVAIGHLWLVVTSWRSRSVLAGFLGAAGIPIALFAVVVGPARNFRAPVLWSQPGGITTGVVRARARRRRPGC